MKLVVSSKLNKNAIDISNYNKKELTSNTSVNLFISSSINSKKDIILSFKKIRFIKKYTDKKNIAIKNIYVFDNPLIDELRPVIMALDIDDIEKRYRFIYDYVCSYLDNEFRTKNICDFKNDICISRRNFKSNPKNYPLIYGCCFTKGRVCPNLINYSCSIKCLSCKLFTCRYLTKKHIKYRINDILLLKLFFNLRQKEVISNQLFTDEDEFIKILMKKKSLI